MRKVGLALAAAVLVGGGAAMYLRTRPPEVSYVLVGQVFDLGGASVAGVRVTATRTDPIHDPQDPASPPRRSGAAHARERFEALEAPVVAEPAPETETRCSADGAFTVRVRAPGTYTLRAMPGAPAVGGGRRVRVAAGESSPPIRLRVEKGETLAGRVVDAQGRGVAGAVVRGSWTREDGRFAPSAPPVVTNGDGRFAWDAVPTGAFTASVDLPRRGRLAGLRPTPSPGEPRVLQLPGTCALSGRVTDSKGVGIAGVDLLVRTGATATNGAGASSELIARTGADGAFRIDGACPGPVTSVVLLPPAPFLPEEQAPPGASWSGALAVVGTELSLDLRLSRGAALEVSVTDDTGTPIEGAEVRALHPRSPAGAGMRLPEGVRTDAAGRARFEGLALGKYALFVRHGTHYLPELERARRGRGFSSIGEGRDPGPPPALVVVLLGEAEVARKTLRLARGLSVAGRVTAADGTPVPGAVVTCAESDAPDGPWSWGLVGLDLDAQAVRTDADGRFRMDAVPPSAALRLQARAKGAPVAQSEPFVVEEGRPAPEVPLTLPVGGTLSGTVIDAEGRPCVGGHVRWRGGAWRARSSGTVDCDGTGAFFLEGLPRGELTLDVVTESSPRQHVRVLPPFGQGERREGFVARLVRPARVAGVVVDTEGRPVVGVSVRGSGQAEPEWLDFADTDAEGRFVLYDLPPGAVEVLPRIEEPDEGDAVPTPWGRRGQVVTAPAEGLRFVVPPQHETRVAARILGPDGAPVPLCYVVPARTGDRDDPDPYVGSEDEVVGGTLRRVFPRARPFDLWVLRARDADGTPLNVLPKRFSVLGDGEVEVRLQPGREVEGRVVGPDWRGVAGVILRSGGSRAETGPDGGFRLRGLPTDRDVTVVASVPAGWVRPQAQTLAKGQSSLRIPLVKGLAIAGRVVGPDGEPWAQGHVVVEDDDSIAAIDGDGRFRLEGLAPDAVVDLTVRAQDGSGGADRTTHVKGVRAGTTDLRIAFEPGVSIAGSVVDAKGRRARGGSVVATPVGADAHERGESHAWIGLDGRFSMAGLRAGPHELKVRSEEGGRTLLTVQAPARDVLVVVPLRAQFEGRLVGAGDRSGFRVSAYLPPSEIPGGVRVAEPLDASWTDADGRFTIEVGRDGPFEVIALKPGDDRFARAHEVVPGTSDPRLILETGLAIEGVITEVDGGPVPPGTWVRASSPDGGIAAEVRAAGSGAFRIRGLPPGRYLLTCRRTRGGSSPAREVEAGTTGHRLVLPGG